ncbi:hypothetical protein EV142_108206 [Flavobacterium circumlabens]|uniref:Uncharacterized protein n=1 Tax=Flavobacterium circumlabens TaxID=2133765 RepID=A0ABY2AV56_9FLAO|nr:hypothetical protein EV142_108206 [Flavobacterium circumlabens]
MKIKNYILILIIAFSCTMCDAPKNKKRTLPENLTARLATIFYLSSALKT